MNELRWICAWTLVLAVVAVGIPIFFRNRFGPSDAIFVYAGAVLTAVVALIADTLTRQQNHRLATEHAETSKQVKLEAATRAGALFASSGAAAPDPAAAASGLIALARLGQAELAVALLVDLWSDGSGQVSTETAILVIDKALRSTEEPNAPLVAAELLCRNAHHLDACQSLHWPSLIDSGWNAGLSQKAKLLVLEALIGMTLSTVPNENALRSFAVRLYGASWDTDKHVKGCVGRLFAAIMPRLDELGYETFIQGNIEVRLKDFQHAADRARMNPDTFLARAVTKHVDAIAVWADDCRTWDDFRGSMATTSHQDELTRTVYLEVRTARLGDPGGRVWSGGESR